MGDTLILTGQRIVLPALDPAADEGFFGLATTPTSNVTSTAT